jgi:Putative Na+/H+ antiporter
MRWRPYFFFLAILHTFIASRFAGWAHRIQHRHDERARAIGRAPSPSIGAEIMHFLGEVEVVFGLWAVALLAAMTAYIGWETAAHYINDTVNYTEPLFVVVIMALASSRPIIRFAEDNLRRLAMLGKATPAAWWLSILTIGPLLGSFITEPAAMTICALLLARQFYDLQPSPRLRYATLGRSPILPPHRFSWWRGRGDGTHRI